jgi:hypothetical protein
MSNEKLVKDIEEFVDQNKDLFMTLFEKYLSKGIKIDQNEYHEITQFEEKIYTGFTKYIPFTIGNVVIKITKSSNISLNHIPEAILDRKELIIEDTSFTFSYNGLINAIENDSILAIAILQDCLEYITKLISGVLIIQFIKDTDIDILSFIYSIAASTASNILVKLRKDEIKDV